MCGVLVHVVSCQIRHCQKKFDFRFRQGHVEVLLDQIVMKTQQEGKLSNKFNHSSSILYSSGNFRNNYPSKTDDFISKKHSLE